MIGVRKIKSSRRCLSSPPPIHEQGRSAKRHKCDWHERRPKKVRVMLIKLLPDQCTKADEADQNGRRKQHQSRAVATPSGCETDDATQESPCRDEQRGSQTSKG